MSYASTVDIVRVYSEYHIRMGHAQMVCMLKWCACSNGVHAQMVCMLQRCNTCASPNISTDMHVPTFQQTHEVFTKLRCVKMCRYYVEIKCVDTMFRCVSRCIEMHRDAYLGVAWPGGEPSLRGPKARIWPDDCWKKSSLGDRTNFQSMLSAGARGGEAWRRNVWSPVYTKLSLQLSLTLA